MRLSVASNYDPKLVEGLSRYPVEELFGKLPADCLGGGRATYMLGQLTRKQMSAHVAHVRQCGFRFNYLLNAACWDNRETTRRGQYQLRRLLDWLVSIGVEAVTVSIPSIHALIKKSYPMMKTRVSVFACVDTLQKARFWQDAGADCICLDSLLVNREFRLLESIRKKISCDLQLLVNNSCLQNCSLANSHMTHLAHASQKGHGSGGFLVDWCFLKCTAMKLDDPINYIRADWIRPEDLHLYRDLGYENFKVVERNAPTKLLLARVKAYVDQRYEGNLLDLVQPYGFDSKWMDPNARRKKRWWQTKFFLRPGKLSLSRAMQLQRLAKARGFSPREEGPPPVYLDNRALDGFMERFQKAGCREIDCDSCGHCRRYADKAVTIDPEFRENCRNLYADLFHDMNSGAFFGCGENHLAATASAGSHSK